MVEFDDTFRRHLRELFVWRRDVRRFRSDPLPDGAIDRLIETACLSPSFGLSQPGVSSSSTMPRGAVP